MSGDVPPLLLAIACLFLTLTPATVTSLPSKPGNIPSANHDISHTDIERLILNTIETVQAQQAINRQTGVSGGTRDDDLLGENALWRQPENTWKTPTLPDLIQDWKDSVKERRDSLIDTGLLPGLSADVDVGDDDMNNVIAADKRSKDYGWGMAFGKRGSSRTQQQQQQNADRQRHKIESRNKDYGWGMAFGKRNEYGGGHMFGKRDCARAS